MRLVKARVKKPEDFPPIESCCAEGIAIQSTVSGMNLTIDLDDTNDYRTIIGHCGQELGYRTGVFVVKADNGVTGYVPFEMIDIDEGEPVAN